MFLENALSGAFAVMRDYLQCEIEKLAKKMREDVKFLHTNTCWSCGCVFMGDVCPNCLATYEVKV